MIIEVGYCERCGTDTPWRIARQAYRGLPGCPLCGSWRVSRCERAQTPEETTRVIDNLRANAPLRRS